MAREIDAAYIRSSPVFLSDADVDSLKVAGKIRISKRLSSDIEEILASYVILADAHSQAPTAASVTKWLGELDHAIERLKTVLQAPERGSGLTRLLAHLPAWLWRPSVDDIDVALKTFSTVQLAAGQAVQRHTPPLLGKPHQNLLIRNLHRAFLEGGGSGTVTYNDLDDSYRGEFFFFVKAALEILDPAYRLRDHALSKAIRRGLKSKGQ